MSWSRFGSRSLHNSRKWHRLHLNLYLEIPTGFRRKQTRTSKRSCCNFGPACIMSFREIPVHLAAQPNTIPTFVVVLSILTTGKCGKYHTLTAVRLMEPSVNIPFRRRGFLSSSSSRCFGGETLPSV